MCPPDATRWLQNHTSVELLFFFFFFCFTKSLRWPANVAARFVFWYIFLIVYKEIVRGEDKYCVTVFYMTGGGAVHDNAHFLCIMFLLCAFMYHVRLLHWNINWEPGLVYVLCRVTFPCRHVTTLAVRAPFFVARVIKTVSSTLNVLGIEGWCWLLFCDFFPPVLLQTLEHKGHSLW